MTSNQYHLSVFLALPRAAATAGEDETFLRTIEALLDAHGLHFAERGKSTASAAGLVECQSYTLHGAPADETQLRQELLSLAHYEQVDIVLQTEADFYQKRKLACFDMDSTLIKAEVIDELAKTAGIGDQVSAITERAMRGELDFKQSFRARMSLLEGLSETVLEGIAEQLQLMDGARELFAGLRARGIKTAILSGGFNYFAREVQQQLGIDYIHANELQIFDGALTGQAVEPIVDAERKLFLLTSIAEEHGLQLAETIACGDGANDLKMIGAAGLGIAFRAKPIVQAAAPIALSISGLDSILHLLGGQQDQ